MTELVPFVGARGRILSLFGVFSMFTAEEGAIDIDPPLCSPNTFFLSAAEIVTTVSPYFTSFKKA